MDYIIAVMQGGWFLAKGHGLLRAKWLQMIEKVKNFHLKKRS